MSSLAAFRKHQGEDLRKLAERHAENDLKPEDKELLKKAASNLAWPTSFGSVLGLGLGLFLAFRVRRARTQMFNAFKTSQKPTHVVFADGRQEAIPDITRFVQPTTAGDFATYFFFGLGGLFVGGESGLLAGTGLAARTVRQDPAAQKRIEDAYRKFRADALRQEAARLDGGGEHVWNWSS